MPLTDAPHVGSVLAGRYELVRHIARGGMGDVYEADDQLLQRRVAVKLYRAASPADRARFDAEVRILAGLNHPGLVRVYDAGPHGDDAFVVLELIDGPPLSASLGEGRTVAPETAAGLGAELADALDYIHQHGVVHRDVTPSNVLCGPDGHPRLVDFGIVRLLDSPRVTSASLAVGTAAFMAPEQVQGNDVTPAADVYALGLVLLECITGRREFVGSVHEVAMARLVRDPDTTTGVPEEWQALLARMVQRDPADRPTAAEVRTRLSVLAGAPQETTAPIAVVDRTGDVTRVIAVEGSTQVFPAAVPAPLPLDAPAPRRGVPVWGMVLGLAAVLVAVLLFAATRNHDPAGQTPAVVESTSTSTTAVAGRTPVRATAPTTTTTTAPTTTEPSTTTTASEPSTSTIPFPATPTPPGPDVTPPAG